MVHHYTIGRDEARDLTGVIAAASRRALERMPGVPRRRVDDLPFAAVVMRRVLRATGARRVVFSANGLREGWYMQSDLAEIRAQDPMLAAGRDYARRLGRDPSLPPALMAWTDPLFPVETRRGAAAARGGVLDQRHRQPRSSRVSRRAGVPAYPAPARHRARPPRPRLSRR